MVEQVFDCGVGSGGPDRVVALIGEAIGLLQEAADDRGWACSGEVLRERVGWVQRLVGVAEGLRLGLVRQVQARPEVVPGAAGGRAAATLLVNGHRVNPWQAGRDVAAAQAGDPEGEVLPLLGAALAAGEISRAHLDVAASALTRIPAAVQSVVLADGRTGLARIDEFLVGYCRSHPPATVRQVVAELVHLLDPDRGDLTADAVARRRLRYRTDPDTGMLSGSFDLDPAAGAELVAALEALAAPADGSAREIDAAAGECEPVLDLRSRPQRLADALSVMAEISMATPSPHPRLGAAPTGPGAGSDPVDERAGLSRRRRADLAIVVSLDQLVAAGFGPLLPTTATAPTPPTTPDASAPASSQAPEASSWSPLAPGRAGLARMALAGGGDRHGALLDPATLARFACDGIWQRVLTSTDGVPLNVGRSQRLATRAQRIALTARDGGCIIPGCAMPVSWCDIHHHLPWSLSGRTDLDNLYPVCGRHHTEVHAGIWQIEWHDGLPWVRPPAGYDRTRRLRRNTTHDARAHARHLAQQINHDLDTTRPPHQLPPADPPPAAPTNSPARTRPPHRQPIPAPRQPAHPTAPITIDLTHAHPNHTLIQHTPQPHNRR